MRLCGVFGRTGGMLVSSLSQESHPCRLLFAVDIAHVPLPDLQKLAYDIRSTAFDNSLNRIVRRLHLPIEYDPLPNS